MKTAIFSDVHACPSAFEKCILDAQDKGCTNFMCLGDIVGYGYDPNFCIEQCRSGGITTLMGNHEAGLIGALQMQWFSPIAKENILRQQEVVTAENKAWLQQLKYSMTAKTEDGFTAAFSHGTFTYPKRFDYINGYSDAAMEFADLMTKGIKVLFVGHTHIAEAYVYEKDSRITENFIDLEDRSPIDLAANTCTIVNVGSCGYPRNQPYSIYCIYDDEKKTATHRILEFDFEDYRLQMEAADISVPLWLDAREEEAKNRRVEWK